MSNKLPKTNSLLPSINYKQCITLIILLLVTSSTTQTPATSSLYECPIGCECDESAFSATCKSLDGLIASYSQKQHKSWHNFMPIKTLDLSNNGLTKLTNQLEQLVNLTELNLSHNQLTQVHKLNFKKLETLNLSNNRITSAKLAKLPKNVVHLNLAHNEITYLPLDLMKLKKLRSLELVGNPLNCTCDTLHVRNFITFQHVRSDSVIVCTSPAIVKGQPWLQARQNNICIEPSTTTTQRSKYNWDKYDDDNELMMGDEPATNDYEIDNDEENEDPGQDVFDETTAAPEVDDEYDNIDDEKKDNDSDDGTIEKGFLPVEQHSHESSTAEPETVIKDTSDSDNDNDDGSGVEPAPQIMPAEEEDDDASGSGGGFLPIIPHIESSSDDLTSEKTTVTEQTDSEEVSEPPSSSTSEVLGIFVDEEQTEAPTAVDAPILVHKAPVQVEKDPNAETEDVIDPINKITDPAATGKFETAKASTEDNTGTYILLAILAIGLVSLIIFVAMKNRREKTRNRRNGDIEKNGATELADMDKNLLGKPIQKNGNGKPTETAPLINDIPEKDEKPSTYTSFQSPPAITVDEPVHEVPLKKSQQSLYENGNAEPVHKRPLNGSAPESDEEVFHPASDNPKTDESLNVSPEPAKRYSPIYQSTSPRSERYSPVYSPETGRVKIRLTETPKPKTPIVVTRSRSRAGDYVNTPN